MTDSSGWWPSWTSCSFSRRPTAEHEHDCWLKSPLQRTYTCYPDDKDACHITALPTQRELSQQLYKALKPHQIRLVQLQPGSFCDPLKCSFVVLDLLAKHGPDGQDDTDYEALSYCWGEPSFNKRILVNDMEYRITASVDRALRSLRYAHRSRKLWIDALCINQHDDIEKSEQVQQMLRIYERARTVVSWLDVGDSVGPFIELMKLFPLPENGRSVTTFSENHEPQCVARLTGLYLTVAGLGSCKWLKRTWVRQEVFAATELRLQFGSAVIDWHTFISVLTHLNHPNDLRDRIFSEFFGVELQLNEFAALLQTLKLDHHRLQMTLNSVTSDYRRGILIWLLLDCNHFAVSNPRDKVYAILGIAQKLTAMSTDPVENEHRRRMPIEKMPIAYTKSVSEVFQDVVKFSIASRDDLAILEISSEPGSRSTLLPSWAPDWRRKLLDARYLYNVGHWTQWRPPKTQNWSSLGRLHLDGIRAGIVRKANLPDYPRLTKDWLEAMDRPLFIADCAIKAQDLSKDTDNTAAAPESQKFLAVMDSEPTTGDIIVLLCGARCPFILRRSSDGDKREFTLVGRVYAIGPIYGKRHLARRMIFQDFIEDSTDWARWVEPIKDTEEFILV
jgi:Heterokaryon incompatibility protein (HET)